MLDTFLMRILVVDTQAKNGDKAKIPKNTEMIFQETFFHIADKLNSSVSKVPETVEIVVNHAVGSCAHGVEGEIPAPGIFPPVVREVDFSATAIGFNVPPERRNLIGLGAGNRRHSAMFDTCRDGF